MADRFDDGREGLSGAEPTRDLWAEAQGRATHETVALSTVPEARRSHPGRWLAAAAVVALIVGVGLAVVSDDGPGVTTSNEGTTPLTAPPPTYGVGTPCPFTVTGDPIQLRTGHVSGGVFDDNLKRIVPAPTVMHGALGDQAMEVSIPGQMVTDLVGERVEDIEPARGTAQLWLRDGFAQVRWFPGTNGPCDSFTVTVFGDNEDFNRHAAVDFADRLVLPTAAAAPTGLVGTWHLVSTTAGGEPHQADGEPFVFTDHDVQFHTGCNQASAPYTKEGAGELRLGKVGSTLAACDNPTERAVTAVMASDATVEWTIVDGELVLQGSGAALVLDPGSATSTTTTSTPDGGDTTTSTTVTGSGTSTVDPAEWPIQGAWDIYTVQGTPEGASDSTEDHPSGLKVTFTGAQVVWDDYCRTETGSVHRIDGQTFSVANAPTGPGFGCTANDAASVIAKVMYAQRIDASLEGAAGSIYLTLKAPSGDQVVLRRTNDGSSPSGDAPLG